MGLLTELDIDQKTANRVQRIVNRFAATRTMSAILSRTLVPMDLWVLRVSRGRTTLTSWAGGLPVVWLTVRGRRSGRPQRVPLTPIPYGDDIALIGTNYGLAGQPSWALNLEVNPDATVGVGSSTVQVRARRVNPDLEEAIWERAVSIYPGYALYRERVQGRNIKVFVLESR